MTVANQTGLTIDKRSHLSKRELFKEYIEPGIPVVLTDAAAKWGGMGKITPEFFKSNYGNVTKEVNGITYTMSGFVDKMFTSTPENPAPYPFNFDVAVTFPELLAELRPEILYGKSDRINHPLLPKFMVRATTVYEFFLGGRGSFFPFLHTDALAMHTQITQLYGAKEFTLYSPDQTPLMYTRPEFPRISRVNIFNPDYEQFPLFRNAVPTKVMINEGETILFPTGWWHATMIYGPSISLGRAQLNAFNWNAFINDNYNIWKKHKPALALPVFVYSKLLGHLMSLQEKFM